MVDQELPYRDLFDFGVGMDRLTGEVKGFPFQDATAEGVQGAAGPITSLDFNKVESYSSLAHAFGIDAKVSARFGLFGADASFKLNESLSMNSYSLYVYAVATASLPFKQVRRPEYRSEALALLKAGRTAEFRQAYGDWFVRGIRSGGRILSIIEIKTKDEETTRTIDADLKGSYGINFSADVAVQDKIKSTFGRASTHVTLDQAGASPRKIEHADQVFDQIMAWLQEMTAPESNVAVPFRMGLVDYKTVPTEAQATFVEIALAEEFLTELADLRLQCLRLKSDVDYILLHQDEFLWENRQDQWVGQLTELAQTLNSAMAKISQAASAQSRDATTRPDFTPEAIPPYQLPKRVEKSGTTQPSETPPPPVSATGLLQLRKLRPGTVLGR